mmetsp:Transcript_7138/g.12516  ORF Transcript_7138/g.12516 Transcript_7138/m.12516 type:complete len:81 (-) Transcript_7138:48-290(-)|eukprot:CAMPEP_0184519518 /NCGR_PEP_ID=MMETSP0198_2-20121128/6673_1 /TAXON_ID=1112570 /ORGANISM="Thraustochytrium sp., Strain LLF1b" /LENGTH=80 /DNA_ID=CAMNT_0026910047 /DNA_START=97 /DNA_END=339 /DNA_ORIENTATION=+
MSSQSVSPEQQQQMLSQVRNEMQAAAMQQMFTTISEKCFQKCVASRPGSELTGTQQKCLAMCMDRYQDAMTVVSKSMQEE